MLLQITGQAELLEANPLLKRSIRNRFPYLDPLNHLQVELLHRYRDGPGQDERVQPRHPPLDQRHRRGAAQQRLRPGGSELHSRPGPAPAGAAAPGQGAMKSRAGPGITGTSLSGACGRASWAPEALPGVSRGGGAGRRWPARPRLASASEAGSGTLEADFVELPV